MRLYDLGGDGSAEASDRILTVPNALSLARLLVLPWLYLEVSSGHLLRGLLVGLLFGATDFVDGYVARRFDQITKLGQLLDPLSDRLFIVTIAVALVVAGLLPWWLVAAVVVRDLLMLAISVILLRAGIRPPPVTRLGKTATFGLMWSFVPLLAAGIVDTAADPQPVLYVIGIGMLVISIVLYWAAAVDYGRGIANARRSADG